MTLDKKMVYKVTFTDGKDHYGFCWMDSFQTWVWAWKDNWHTYVTAREVKEILSLCEHFPDHRTLTISPAGTSAEREFPTGKL